MATTEDVPALLESIRDELARIGAHVDELHAEFKKYAPILEAYIRPDAAGPAAWAVRRVIARGERHSNGTTHSTAAGG